MVTHNAKLPKIHNKTKRNRDSFLGEKGNSCISLKTDIVKLENDMWHGKYIHGT